MRERTPFPASLIARLPRLQLLVTTGSRNAVIDLGECQQRGIAVCGTRGLGTTTSELAGGLLLALARNISLEDRAIRDGGWQTATGTSLNGKTLGILGLGRKGKEVAGFGRAFGMEVIAWSPNLTPARAAEACVGYRPREVFFAEADAISVHMVLAPTTRHLLGAAELALMKQTALIVNTSRGPIIDTLALCAALNQGQIGGCALDVFDEEPLPAGHPLLAAPNTVLSPHKGYVTDETYRIFFKDAVENIASFLAGQPLREIRPKEEVRPQ
jgi:phosphoglycerate dehydrogenase-like enzyme